MPSVTSFHIIGLGEALWDCFPERRLPGGAPANVAFHAQQLGLSATVATRVGCDSLGDELIQFFESQGLRTALIQRDPVHGTGTVTVEPQATHTTYTFLENSAWDFLAATDEWLAAARQARAIVFGTLAQRREQSRETIHKLLAAAQAECLIVFDVNLRPPFFTRAVIENSLRKARIVKLNDEEVRVLAQLLETNTHTEIDFARWVLRTFGTDLVCITRGAAGALLVSQHEVHETPGIPIQVVDTVGAGDAFTAALIWSRCHQWPLDRSLQLANRLGALVASRPGAMPVLKAEIARLLSIT